LGEEVWQGRGGIGVIAAQLPKTRREASNPWTLWIVEVKVRDHVHTGGEATNLVCVIGMVHKVCSGPIGDDEAERVIRHRWLSCDRLKR
jgi:hypothetical protein